MSEAEPLYPNIHHSRLPSGASSISSSASDSPVSGICTHISPLRHMTIHIMRIVAVYPSFDLYPLPSFCNDGLDSNSDNSALSPNCPVGLLQPSSPFIHHGYAVKFFLMFIFYLIQRLLSFFACQFRANCTQIPKLRIACASGVNGYRTMWSHCESCGAISVVECD